MHKELLVDEKHYCPLSNTSLPAWYLSRGRSVFLRGLAPNILTLTAIHSLALLALHPTP